MEYQLTEVLLHKHEQYARRWAELVFTSIMGGPEKRIAIKVGEANSMITQLNLKPAETSALRTNATTTHYK